MTFTGSFAAVNTALAGLSFNPTTSFTGAASLQIVTADQGNTGTGGTQTDNDTVAITVAASARPVVTATVANLAYTENASAVALDAGITVADSDSNITGATISMTTNYVSRPGRAELQHPERHHRQLGRGHRRTDPVGHRHAGHLPDRAALDHLRQQLREPGHQQPQRELRGQ